MSETMFEKVGEQLIIPKVLAFLKRDEGFVKLFKEVKTIAIGFDLENDFRVMVNDKDVDISKFEMYYEIVEFFKFRNEIDIKKFKFPNRLRSNNIIKWWFENTIPYNYGLPFLLPVLK